MKHALLKVKFVKMEFHWFLREKSTCDAKNFTF